MSNAKPARGGLLANLDTAVAALETIAWNADAPTATDRQQAMAEAAAWMAERPSRPVPWVVARSALHALPASEPARAAGSQWDSLTPHEKAVRSAWNYMQSPGSYSDEEKSFVFELLNDAYNAKPASEPAGGGVREALRAYHDAYSDRRFAPEGSWEAGDAAARLEDAHALAEAALSSAPATPSPAEAEALPAGVDAGRELAPGLVAVFYRDGVLEGDQAAAASEFLEGVVKGLFARLSASAPAPEERAVPAEVEAKEGRS